MKTRQSGVSRIEQAFAVANTRQSAALMPYYTLGYPDRESSLSIIEAVAPYSDLMELGVPFSDPLADGPTIQRSTQVALENGTTVRTCLSMVRRLRSKGIETPILLMGYYNPIMAYDEHRFVQDAAAAGVDGLIVPDLPPEEAGPLEEIAAAAGLAFIHFLSPISSPDRIQGVSARASGFIYLVSVTGVTGARTSVQSNLSEFVSRVRRQTSIPLAVGFGISTPEQAASVAGVADGVIVGSALINTVDSAHDKPAAAAEFARSLRQVLIQ